MDVVLDWGELMKGKEGQGPPQMNLRKLMYAVMHWRKIRATMPLQYVYTFLLVALNEGKSVQEYANMAGIGQTTMSRHLLDLGPRNRHMEPGFGLVDVHMSPTDMRQHVVKLTPKGRGLMHELEEIMGRAH